MLSLFRVVALASCESTCAWLQRDIAQLEDAKFIRKFL